MVYNGFVIVDTHGIDDPNVNPFKEWKESGFRNYHEESSDYPVPAGPGGGGSTPPTTPMYGPFLNPPAGGSGSTGSTTSGGGGWQQWVNPQTIAAGTQLVATGAGAIGSMRSPDKARIKAVCGRKPLFNIGGKKDAYNDCVQRLMMPQQPVYTPQPGMSATTKIIIGVLAFLVLLAIIIGVVMMMRKQPATT